MALTDTFVKQIKHGDKRGKAGVIAKWNTAHGQPTDSKWTDGDGMFLHVKASGKYWRMDYTLHGKRRTLALGVYPAVSLADARKGRTAAQELIARGIDPSTSKQDARHAEKLAAANTFELIAREFHAIKADSWSESHATKWIRMNELYLFPEIGGLPISTIRAKQVLGALKKVQAKGILSTAHDLQQMAGQVFRYAVQTGRIDQNPIPDLKGALMPHIAKNFAAIIDPVAAGELLRAIDTYTGQATTQAAMKLSALIFQRPGNIRAMEWAWVDLNSFMLTIPAQDMKRTKSQKVNGKPHLIPLAKQSVKILTALKPLTGNGRYVFPGARSYTRPMSENTVNAALKRLDFGTDDHVAHGFRAMAKTMLTERLKGIDPGMVEAQMAHGKSGPLGSAYDRAEFMEQRKEMMQTWADYLDKLRKGADVIEFKAA